MTRKDVTVKGEHAVGPSGYWPIGETFLYRSSVWKVKGLYLTSSPAGGRDTWWILGQQPRDEDEMDGGA